MESGEWRVESGERRVESGEWRVEDSSVLAQVCICIEMELAGPNLLDLIKDTRYQAGPPAPFPEPRTLNPNPPQQYVDACQCAYRGI